MNKLIHYSAGDVVCTDTVCIIAKAHPQLLSLLPNTPAHALMVHPAKLQLAAEVVAGVRVQPPHKHMRDLGRDDFVVVLEVSFITTAHVNDDCIELGGILGEQLGHKDCIKASKALWIRAGDEHVPPRNLQRWSNDIPEETHCQGYQHRSAKLLL